MTVEELITFITSELGNVKDNPYFDKNMAELQEIVKKHKTFSPDAFKEWFVNTGVVFKNNPLGFLCKCGFEDIRNGKFDNKSNVFDVQSLCAVFRRYGFKIGCETTLIEIVEGYILEKGLMSPNDLRAWNNEAIGYLINLDKKTTKDFVTLFDKSKSMKALKLPLKDMKQEAVHHSEEWSAIMKELDETPPVPAKEEGEEDNGKIDN